MAAWQMQWQLPWWSVATMVPIGLGEKSSMDTRLGLSSAAMAEHGALVKNSQVIFLIRQNLGKNVRNLLVLTPCLFQRQKVLQILWNSKTMYTNAMYTNGMG